MKKSTFYFLVLIGLINIPMLMVAQDEPIHPAVVSTGKYWGLTPPLNSLPVMSEEDWKQLAIKAQEKELNKKVGERPYPFQSTALPIGPDEAWQMEMGTKSPLAPLVNFAGQASPYYPSDANGDVNQDYYFQTINTVYAIYNKAGALVAGPTNLNLLFGAVPGSNCNDGDPIVLWDEQAGRWLVAEFSLCNANDRMLVAVSQTNNPLGAWYQYSFDVTDVPDYEKFGVWQDGYYMGTNTGAGNDIYVLQRDQMLVGGAPVMIGFDNAWRPNSGFHCVPPADNDGAYAPSGYPGIFVTINNDAWGGLDQLWIYQLAVNWVTPASSTFTRTQTIGVAAFDNNFGAGWNNITQPGTAQKLDAVLEVLMQRPQYRNFGSYQTIVCCHTVDVDGTDHAGVRWYELRRTTGDWSIRQTGTYAPDANSRWMASIALNSYNELGLGYSISSAALYPGIRYCGQSSTAYAAGLGTMDIAEDIILTGATSQTGTNRWGDYTMLTVDPSDNRTFWYTNQYVLAGQRATRIASFKFGGYCAASGGCDEYISRVQLGTIDNITGCNNYADYTGISTNFGISETKTITVTNGNPIYTADQCGIWIDWNKDEDFADANETITVIGTPGVGPYTASITPPVGTAVGTTRMRVRITYTGAVDPCGTTTYGEVEDYSINLIDYCTASGGCDEYISRIQFGTIDNITGCSGYANYTGISTNLGLTATKTLTVTNGNPIYFADQCGAWIDWNRDTDFADANESISISGTPGIGPYTASITPPAGTTPGPVRIRVRITYTGAVDPCGSTVYGEVEDYTINLVGPNYWVGGFNHYWHQAANWSAGHIPTEDEDVFLTNLGYQPVYIDDYPGVPNEACNNLTVEAGGQLQVWDMTLNINGTLAIYGQLSMIDALGLINIKGNWINYAGLAGFTAGPGKVVFNGGAYHQYCSNETFNILEVNKAAGGAFRPYNDNNVVCAAYDWTAGAVDVLTGSFTANNLLDNGIAGAFYNNAGGTINLTNSYSGWVDLNGELHIYGGTVNVYGTLSDWPYSNNALIEMNAGVLDFHTCGITIANNAYTLTNNITGGIIRTAYGFSGNRADFTPSAGTFEFYGISDAFFSQSNGCTLWDVNVNKAAKEVSLIEPELPVSGERIDKTAGKGGKANSVSLNSNVVITNNLIVSAGILEIGAYTCSVAKSAFIYGTLSMTNPSGVLNVGTNLNDLLYFVSGSFGNLSAGIINLPYALIIENGALFSSSTGNTINFGTTLNFGGIANYDPNATFGNINVNMNGGKWIFDPSSSAPITVNGNFTVFPGNSVELFNNSLIIHGILTDNTTSAIYVYDGPVAKESNSLMMADEIPSGKSTGAKGGILEIDTDFTLNGLMDVADGNVLVHGIFHLASSGNLLITTGSFIADGPLFTKNWEYIDGHLGLTSGLFEISHNSINFSATATTTMSGGIMRSGEAFGAVSPGTFQPTGGTVEIVGVGFNTLYCNSGNYFYNLLINRDPAAASYLYTDITVSNALTVNSGTLTLNSFTANVLGGVNINGGNILVNDNANLLLANATTLNVNAGGALNVIASAGTPGRIARISTGNYGLNVQSGGNIAALNGIFEYMNTSGVNLMAGSNVDPLYPFNNCTFRNGQAAGRLMTIETNQLFNVENAVFPTNTWSGAYNVYKSVNTGTVNFVSATGGFAGESFDFDPNNRVNWTNRMLNLKAFLEGPFNGSTMNTTINNVLPLNHPFNPALPYFGNPMPDWYYAGAGSVGAIPNVNIVDWIEIEIRDAATAATATKATAVAHIPAFILNNGTIVSLDGISSPQVPVSIVNNLYVVIYQRNHEAIMNANLIPYSAGVYTYDYSTGSGQVFGGVAGTKQLASGIWGMRSGDGDGNGDVQTADRNNVWKATGQTGKVGYLPSDFNLDRQTNNKDKNDKWVPNIGTGSQVPN
jgi:hypothetical protein